MVNDINNLYKFMDNMNINTGHVSNVYVARLYSPNGDVKEYYGMNLLTDLGFKQFFDTDSSISFASNLYVGDGTGSFDKTSTQLMSPLFDGLAATTLDSSILYNYPLYYAKGDQNDNGRITTVTRYRSFRYAENITNVLSDVVISEYGVGTAWNVLWTHSYVYDLQGDRAVIIKHPGERLDIEVFFCCSFLERLIMSGWSDNNYTAITTGELMMKQMNVTTATTFKRTDYDNNNGRIERTIGTRSRSAIIDSKITKTTNLSTFVLSPSVENDRYIDGFAFEAGGFISFSKQQLLEPETITTDLFYSHDPFDKSGFADSIGRDIPITQMDIISVNRCNDATGEWDDACFYNNSPIHLFDETPMNTAYALPYYYTSDGVVRTLYLYQNLNVDDPIVSIRGEIETIYATDKYWYGPNLTGNDWIRITNREVIPAEAQRKRYWLMGVNNVAPNPVRAGTFYLMQTQDDYGETYTPTKYRDLVYGAGFMSMDNPNYNVSIHYSFYEAGGSRLQFFEMDTNWVETIPMSYNWIGTFGKWVMIDCDRTYRFYDISTLSQHVLNPPVEIATSTRNGNHTENDNGLMCNAYLYSNALDVIDLRQPTPTVTTIQNARMGCCMWHNNYIAYVNADGTKLIIHDFDTSTNVYEFNLPAELTSSVNVMFAHTYKVWLVTSEQIFVCDIRTGVFTQYEITTDNQYIRTSNSSGLRVKCADRMVILYGDYTSSTYRTSVHVLSVDDRNIVRHLSGSDLDDGGNRFVIGESVHQVGNSLMMFVRVISTYWAARGIQYYLFYDLGSLLDTGSKKHIYVTKDAYVRGFVYKNHFVYDAKMYPLTNFTPIKITCRTKTITTATGQKGISNKQFSITVSNTPTFSGKPPGNLN